MGAYFYPLDSSPAIITVGTDSRRVIFVIYEQKKKRKKTLPTKTAYASVTFAGD